MKTLYTYGIFVFAVALIFVFSAATFTQGDEPRTSNKEIIKFSHQFHVALTTCESCHARVTESSDMNGSLLPTKPACAECHDVTDESMCSTCHYDAVFESLQPQKSSILFNHKLHTQEMKAECTMCHKGLDAVDYAYESASAVPEMEQCYTCHNNTSGAITACETCHTSTADLIPDSHLVVNFSTDHKFDAKAGFGNCAMCHSEDYCQTCHVATTGIGSTNTGTDFYTPYSPNNSIDGPKMQQLTRVHDLNFRFSHAIDAKGGVSECLTCHERETFCAECHSAEGGDYALSGNVPVSHLTSNFVTIGVGSGGGDHGQLAKRDIEQCASCHDTQGGDPTCIMCHVDNDGIKNTNPKTHGSDFMTSEEGDWHESEASVCYNCHTDANARPSGIAGVGFCGYCHDN